jgi:hypothetical protein
MTMTTDSANTSDWEWVLSTMRSIQPGEVIPGSVLKGVYEEVDRIRKALERLEAL